MNRLLAIIAILSVVGFGCITKSQDVPPESEAGGYENAQYGFSFSYPTNLEVREREEANRATKYLGFDADFFISLRDTVRDVKPTNIAWFYAAPNMTVEKFTAALEASNSDGAVKVKSVEDVTVNGFAMKKMTSSTEMGEDKVHYLFDHNGTLIIVSVFIAEEETWGGVLQTMDKM